MLYRRMWDSQTPSEPKCLRVREAGGNPLLFRPGTTDLKVLWDTFYHKYHLPPVDLKPDCTIVDLGAYVGYTVAHFAYLYPKSLIIAVELDKDNIKIASQNIKFFQARCELKHAAVWSKNGHVAYGGEEEWGFHVFDQDSDIGTSIKRAPARTLDSIFEEYNLENVDYLKMDIEGAEANVLKGPMNWIKFVQSMKIEVHPQFNPEATAENCMQILQSLGFKCRKDNFHPQSIIAVK